ncbi:copper resistance protein CopC [Oceanobacillus longus]|uniref:Copper resistance protein CopC n=1 Tax=Oceanobacillus longus TaxID=930120 RepID=A0ABV8GVQ4_9BACI
MKKMIALTFIFLFILTNQTFAHTGLESSNPENGSTVNETLTDITLSFETTIEQASTFELQNGTGETISVNDITISDNIMEGTLTEPLENDQYTVLWNIIGVDGHPIQGEFSFTVDTPVNESISEEEKEPADSENSGDATNQSDSMETIETDTESADVQATEGSNTLMIVIIVVLVVVVAAIIWLRRKNK